MCPPSSTCTLLTFLWIADTQQIIKAASSWPDRTQTCPKSWTSTYRASLIIHPKTAEGLFAPQSPAPNCFFSSYLSQEKLLSRASCSVICFLCLPICSATIRMTLAKGNSNRTHHLRPNVSYILENKSSLATSSIKPSCIYLMLMNAQHL